MKWKSHICAFWVVALVQTCALAAATSTLPASRLLQFDDYSSTNWTHEGPLPSGIPRQPLKAGTNHYHVTGWRLLSCRTGTARGIGLEVAPDSATNLAANLQNTLGAQIESPIFQEGIGTVYFEAINNVELNQVTVEWSTNMVSSVDPLLFFPMNPPSTNGLEYVWMPLDELTLNAVSVTEFLRYRKLVNFRQPVKVRIRRTGTIYPDKTLDDALTVIDNIRVSPPPSDVVIYKTECPFEPGYPSVNTNMLIRCFVDNADMHVPTDSRTNRVVYRWRYLDQVTNAWKTNLMSRVGIGDGQGNGERFEATLPPQPQVGDLEYFFICDFDGYRFQSPDYTGTGINGYPYPAEWLSPRTLRGGAGGSREFYTRIRPYKSPYGALYVVADTNKFPQPIEMALVGDDEWRGMVPIRSVSATNISWYFKGANAYIQGADTFSTNHPSWAEQAQVGVGRVPYGGVCVTTETQRINVTAAEGGYVQMVLNTRTLDFMTSRAEYQNFNEWPARDTKFSDSSGQDPRRRFLNTFEGWSTNVDQTFNEYVIGYVSTTNTYARDPFLTPQQWVAGSAAYVSERNEADYNNKPTGVLGFRNLALRLKGGDGALGLGYVYNTVATRPDGLKQLSFKCRLGQPASNFDVAYNQTDFTKTNFLVRANVQMLTPMSPEQPSVSLIGYYQNPGRFYEYRITQMPDPTNPTTGRDRRAYHQLFKWVDGIPTQLTGALAIKDGDLPLTSSWTLEMRLFTTSSSSTRIRCKYGTVDNVLAVTDSTSPISAGSYGFLSADGNSSFSAVFTQPTTTDAIAFGSSVSVLDAGNSAVFDTQKPNWYTPAGRFEATRAVTPFGIYSVVPTQKIGVYLQDSDYNSTVEPAAPGSLLWKKAQEITVPNFGYSSVSVPVNSWKSQFVMLQVSGGDADVAVDELGVSSWHGKPSSDSGNGNSSDWLATEAWVVSNSVPEANVVQLDQSRANPAIDQAIRSPVLDTGMGLMEFDYRVLRAPAKLTVQFATKNDSTVWVDVQSFATATTTAWTHASAYLGNTTSGYFRVLNERSGVYTNALVEINNAVAWDEPLVNATSWKVYNAKITDTDLMRVSLDLSKACFLNNSQTLDTEPIQDQSEPYVQTPLLPAGLGELKFNARAYTNNQPATVYVYASTNGWGASSNLWFEITRFENISNTLYQSYAYQTLVGEKYDAIRLMTKTPPGPAARRVCLEEIAVSEPVFPGFDIVNVKVLCKENDGSYSTTRFQPLISDDVGVEAQIANKQLTPSNILMYVTYYLGTNAWGVDNWPAGQTVTKPMYPTLANPLVYRTSPTNDIPVQELDQVVQYHVWASYLGGVPLIKEQETFENPSWYYPLDLNVTFASRGWSPYYIVYGVPLGAVWINEINATDYVISNGVQVLGIGDNPYIELAVPAGVDLAGWRVELVTTEGYATETIQIPAGLPPQVASTNGYAFFVIGEHPAFRPANVPPLPKLDYGFPGLTDLIPRIMPGGLRLRRPQGMYEQTSAYDWNADYGAAFSGTNWAANDPEHRFVYVGREHNGGSLSVTNGAGQIADDWVFPWEWTPGSANAGQLVPSADAIMPGVSNVLVTSVMNLGNATQNGVRTTYYTLKLRLGDSTNIVYAADAWYRIYSVKENQVEQLPPGSVATNYTLNLPDIQTNINVDVTVGLRQDIAGLAGDPALLNWLLGFGDAPLVSSPYNGRTLSLNELYWLNANPTVTNRVDFMVTKFNVDAVSNAHATVTLALNGQSVTNLQGNSVMKLNVKQDLTDPEWSLLAQYSLSKASFDSNRVSRVTIENPFSYVIRGWDPQGIYCRGMLEMEDPRVIVQELITEP